MTSKEKIIWTSKMKQLRDEIRDKNTGVFACDLSDEDIRDFVNYLGGECIPVLMLYTIDYPCVLGNLYDGDYEVVTNELNCVAHFVLDAPTKHFLEMVDECAEVRLYNGYEGQSEESLSELEKNTRIIGRYTKRVAAALQDFSEVGVILDCDTLASEVMGEFFPGYCSSEAMNNVVDDDKITFTKSKFRFAWGGEEYNVRRGSFGYVVFRALLVNGEEELSYSQILDWLGYKDCSRARGGKIKDSKKYLAGRIREKLGWSGEVVCLDEKNEIVTLSPEFRGAVVVKE